MNKHDLYESFNEIDDDILERSEQAVQTNSNKASCSSVQEDNSACTSQDIIMSTSTLDDINYQLTSSNTTIKIPKVITKMKYGILVACLCLITTVLLTYFTNFGDSFVAPPNNYKENNAQHSEVNIVKPYTATSDTYQNLSELLTYLSKHDTHTNRTQDTFKGSPISFSSNSAHTTEGLTLVESNGVALHPLQNYAYHIGENCVYISKLDGMNTENVGTIDINANAIFVCNEHLLIISPYQSGGNELNREMSVRISIYDIQTPTQPILENEYTQLGTLTSCFMVGADLYLITEDGVCACGFSRFSNMKDYYPALSHNNEAIVWDDDDISILGTPTSIQYSAITIINGNDQKIRTKKALYGNIENIFYGEDWLAVSVSAQTDTTKENPSLYTFDSDLHFTGKIDTAQLLNAPSKYEYHAQNIQSFAITSVTKVDDIYRLLGTSTIKENEVTTSSFLAITADFNSTEVNLEEKQVMLDTTDSSVPLTHSSEVLSSSELTTDKKNTEHITYQLFSTEHYPNPKYTEILWEEQRAIACVSVHENSSYTEVKNKFLFVEFDGLEITFHEMELYADYLDGRVGVSYGNPLGEFTTLIPMGNGIYVRYANMEEGPKGFDIFDFSEGNIPQLLYHCDTAFNNKNAFDYISYIYDENTFGTLKIQLGDDDYFRDVQLSWCIYSVEPTKENKIELQKEYPLHETIKTFFGGDALGYVIFQVDEHFYYITKNTPSAIHMP